MSNFHDIVKKKKKKKKTLIFQVIFANFLDQMLQPLYQFHGRVHVIRIVVFIFASCHPLNNQ